MKTVKVTFLCGLVWSVCWATAFGGTQLIVEHRGSEETTAAFRLEKVPAPRKADAASKARFEVVDGQRDPNGGELDQLHDGRLPTDEDQPAANFFFSAGTDGGRILLDLGQARDLKQVNTYSWHAGTRGPQVYTLYSATGSPENFNAEPKREVDPLKCGWRLVAKVDTRGDSTDRFGGQYAVSIQDSTGSLGSVRYLLFDVRQTETNDAFGNTFYSEIDVVDDTTPESPAAPEAVPKLAEEVIQTGDYTIVIDTTETPDLTDWAHTKVAPMAREWYPKLAELLPSEGYVAPRTVRIIFSKDMSGVAATGGTRIRCAAGWFRRNLDGEALGAVFHELVHVVQQYGRARPVKAGATRAPGWLVEGIADYVRWFKFEPQSRGAEITSRNLSRARYDGNYRITANFLDWVSRNFEKDLVPQLNAAIREGRYSETCWKERTGRTVEDLGAEWKAAMEKKVAAENGSQDKRLPASE